MAWWISTKREIELVVSQCFQPIIIPPLQFPMNQHWQVPILHQQWANIHIILVHWSRSPTHHCPWGPYPPWFEFEERNSSRPNTCLLVLLNGGQFEKGYTLYKRIDSCDECKRDCTLGMNRGMKKWDSRVARANTRGVCCCTRLSVRNWQNLQGIGVWHDKKNAMRTEQRRESNRISSNATLGSNTTTCMRRRDARDDVSMMLPGKMSFRDVPGISGILARQGIKFSERMGEEQLNPDVRPFSQNLSLSFK